MNLNPNTKPLPFLTACLGLITLILRLGLEMLGKDSKGLLIPGHPLDLLVWAVTLAAILLILLTVLPLNGSPRYTDNFSASTAAAIGCFALAGGIVVSTLLGYNTNMRLDLVRRISGLLAIPALIWAGLCRWQGKQPFFLTYALASLYLTMHAISHYQVWSSRPQLQNWIFCMAASILLALFAYYQTAFCVSLGKRRMQLGTGLLAAFFGLSAAAGGEDMMLYLGGAVWALTDLCNLTPVRRRPNPITESAGNDRHESA